MGTFQEFGIIVSIIWSWYVTLFLWVSTGLPADTEVVSTLGNDLDKSQ